MVYTRGVDVKELIESQPSPGMSVVEYLEEQKLIKAQEEEDLVNNLFRQITTIGQPTKFRPEFIKTLLMHMGIKGKSYKSLAFKLGVASVKTLYNWEVSFPVWKKAKEVAQSGRLGYIEEMLTGLADGTYKGNAAAAIFYAKNACPDEFKDNRDIAVSGGVTYMIDTGIPSKELPAPISEAIEAEFVELSEEESLEDLL